MITERSMRVMNADPRTNASHGRRWALWLFMFVGFVLHSSLCPSGVHAGVLTVTTRTCAAPVAGAPEPTIDADRPCAPMPGPHHHAPCGVMTHRAAPQDRSIALWPAGAPPRRAPAAADAGSVRGPGGVRPWRSSSVPAPRSGAGLLIDLCASRT
jgi:hypothetical protein